MRSVLLLVPFLFISLVLAGKFPKPDSVIGGVPKDKVTEPKLKVTVRTPTTTITPGKLRYGNSETTPGVYQASGYADLTSSQSMWFWFFAARNNPDTAPLSLWLNGGPGSSSMIGLFQEVGPCRINQDETTVSRNPYAWNEYSNMLFIDQPIGTGYSHGELVVSTSRDAAVAVWKMLQIFFADPKFSKYATCDFAIWTQSYGGHYGPAFASYFLDQNAAIDAGKINGIKINLKVLSIGNGLTDPYFQYPSFVEYAMSNPYHTLVDDSTIVSIKKLLYGPGGCLDQIKECNLNLDDTKCLTAGNYCNINVMKPLAGDYDFYDVRVKSPSPYPYNITKLLTDYSFMAQIGAESNWIQTNRQAYGNFAATGEWVKSFRPDLEKVINAGVRTLILAGDADYICNYIGLESMVAALQTKFKSKYNQQKWKKWTVSGTAAGQYKNSGTFSYLRVYQAGHEVPAYGNGKLAVGQAALVYFTQTMQGKPISSA